MISLRRSFFKSGELDNLKDYNYGVIVYLFLEWYKSYGGTLIFSVNMFLDRYGMSYNSRNIKSIKSILNYMIKSGLIKVGNLRFSENKDYYDSVDFITRHDFLEIDILSEKDSGGFTAFSEEFIVEVLDRISSSDTTLKVYKVLEVYFLIILHMFELHGQLEPVSLPYSTIIDKTGVKSKTTVNKCIALLSELGLLEYKTEKGDVFSRSKEGLDFYYNIYTFPDDLQSLRK